MSLCLKLYKSYLFHFSLYQKNPSFEWNYLEHWNPPVDFDQVYQWSYFLTWNYWLLSYSYLVNSCHQFSSGPLSSWSCSGIGWNLCLCGSCNFPENSYRPGLPSPCSFLENWCRPLYESKVLSLPCSFGSLLHRNIANCFLLLSWCCHQIDLIHFIHLFVSVACSFIEMICCLQWRLCCLFCVIIDLEIQIHCFFINFLSLLWCLIGKIHLFIGFHLFFE